MIACSPFPPLSHDTIQNMSEWRIQLFLGLAQKLTRWNAINESSALKISAQKQQVLFGWLSTRISFKNNSKKHFLHHFFSVYLSCCFQGCYIFAVPLKIFLHRGKSRDWQISVCMCSVKSFRDLLALNASAAQAAETSSTYAAGRVWTWQWRWLLGEGGWLWSLFCLCSSFVGHQMSENVEEESVT